MSTWSSTIRILAIGAPSEVPARACGEKPIAVRARERLRVTRVFVPHGHPAHAVWTAQARDVLGGGVHARRRPSPLPVAKCVGRKYRDFRAGQAQFKTVCKTGNRAMIARD